MVKRMLISVGWRVRASEKRNILTNSCRKILTSTVVSADAGVAYDTLERHYKYANGAQRDFRHTLNEDDLASDAGQGKVAGVDVRRDTGCGEGGWGDAGEGHSG